MSEEKIYKVKVMAVNDLEQELANFFGKGLECKYYRLCRPKR